MESTHPGIVARNTEFIRPEENVLKINSWPTPTSIQRSIIREMVAQHLKEQKSSEPTELASLHFNFKENELLVADINPLFIAVEFALQGKAIVIQASNTHGDTNPNAQTSFQLLQKIRQLMNDMGVPDERISVIAYHDEINQNNILEAGQPWSPRIDFQAF